VEAFVRHYSFDDIEASAAASAPLTVAPVKHTYGYLREDLLLERNIAHEHPGIAEPSRNCPARMLAGDVW
jgi:hypothetical protein